MDAGQKVFRGKILYTLEDVLSRPSRAWYLESATGTGIEVDGKPLVRVHTVLVPAEGWVGSEREAKQAVVTQLVRLIGGLQGELDRLRDELLHDDLTSEEAAA